MKTIDAIPANARRACRLGFLLAVSAPLGMAACAPAEATPPADRASAPPLIAEVHAEKCGACHSLPAAKTRSRPYLERALARHHRRVRLTDEEWRALIDYLAAPGSVAVESLR